MLVLSVDMLSHRWVNNKDNKQVDAAFGELNELQQKFVPTKTQITFLYLLLYVSSRYSDQQRTIISDPFLGVCLCLTLTLCLVVV
jgi:hypothetical protein